MAEHRHHRRVGGDPRTRVHTMSLPKCRPGTCELDVIHRVFVYGRRVTVYACRVCHYVGCAVAMAGESPTNRKLRLLQRTSL